MFQLIRLIVVFLLIYFLYRLFKGVFRSSKPEVRGKAEQGTVSKEEDLVEDPHCHRYLPMSQAYKTTISGKDVFFCSRACCEEYKSGTDK